MTFSTTEEALTAWRDGIGAVPSVANDYVCDTCLGPVAKYARCWGCNQLVGSGVPQELRAAVVPMTSALNPSAWYNALALYKTFDRPKGAVLAAVTYHFVHKHAGRIAAALGGPHTLMTIVPSKRGIAYDNQPLKAALSLVEPLRNMLQPTLRYVPDEYRQWSRRHYSPTSFERLSDVHNARILLVEDTWVTGATAVSAAGRLLELGARSVIILPIARCVNDAFLSPDHPYRDAMWRRLEGSLANEWPR